MNINQMYLIYQLRYPSIPDPNLVKKWLNTINSENLYFYLIFFIVNFNLFNHTILPEMRYYHILNYWMPLFFNSASYIKKQWISLYYALASYKSNYQNVNNFFINKYNELLSKQIKENDKEIIYSIYQIENLLLTFTNLDDNFKWHLINRLNTYSDEIKSYTGTEEITFY